MFLCESIERSRSVFSFCVFDFFLYDFFFVSTFFYWVFSTMLFFSFSLVGWGVFFVVVVCAFTSVYITGGFFLCLETYQLPTCLQQQWYFCRTPGMFVTLTFVYHNFVTNTLDGSKVAGLFGCIGPRCHETWWYEERGSFKLTSMTVRWTRIPFDSAATAHWLRAHHDLYID